MPCSSRAAKRKRIMDTLHTRRFGRILALSWLIVLLAACSVADPAVGSARAATTLPLGTTFWTYRGVSSVFTAAWSPDGKHLALGEADGTVQVRDAITNDILFTIHGHASHVWAVAWSPDGKRLASASWDKTVQVWEVTTGHRILTYRGHADIVGAVAWSPDGKRIASVGDDVRIWQA